MKECSLLSKPRECGPTDLVKLGPWGGHLLSVFVRKALGGHHGGCCYSGTTADAQAAQLFHPRSRCPEEVTEELCCSQRHSSSCKLPWSPSTFSHSHPCKEKHSIKVGQKVCCLPMTVDKMAQLPFGCLRKVQHHCVLLPQQLCSAQRSVTGNR